MRALFVCAFCVLFVRAFCVLPRGGGRQRRTFRGTSLGLAGRGGREAAGREAQAWVRLGRGGKSDTVPARRVAHRKGRRKYVTHYLVLARAQTRGRVGQGLFAAAQTGTSVHTRHIRNTHTHQKRPTGEKKRRHSRPTRNKQLARPASTSSCLGLTWRCRCRRCRRSSGRLGLGFPRLRAGGAGRGGARCNEIRR